MEKVLSTQQPSQEKSSFWRDHIAGWESSQISQAKYCKQENISYVQFCYWRNKFSEKKHRPADTRLLPVQLSAQNLLPPLRIRLPNQVVLELPANTPSSQLASLFKLMGVGL